VRLLQILRHRAAQRLMRKVQVKQQSRLLLRLGAQQPGSALAAAPVMRGRADGAVRRRGEWSAASAGIGGRVRLRLALERAAKEGVRERLTRAAEAAREYFRRGNAHGRAPRE
jgi:hypothetical protein